LRAAELAKQRGDVAVAQRHGDAAAARLRAVAEQFPANAESWFGLGVLAERQGASAEAIAAYEQALARDAGHTGSLLNLAALRAASNPEAAKLLWRRLLAADAEQRVLSPGERRRLQRLVAAN
ncbi:MAG: tetratricopeptide repeat protein, partial [Planctomycetota bacterium]